MSIQTYASITSSKEKARFERRLFETDRNSGKVPKGVGPGVYLAGILGGSPEDIQARNNLIKVGSEWTSDIWSKIDSGEMMLKDGYRIADRHRRSGKKAPPAREKRTHSKSEASSNTPPQDTYVNDFQVEVESLKRDLDTRINEGAEVLRQEFNEKIEALIVKMRMRHHWSTTDEQIRTLLVTINDTIGTFLGGAGLNADGLIVGAYIRECLRDVWHALNTFAHNLERARGTAAPKINVGGEALTRAFKMIGFDNFDPNNPPPRAAARKAYHKRARTFHPDVLARNNNPEMVALNDAYQYQVTPFYERNQTRC